MEKVIIIECQKCSTLTTIIHDSINNNYQRYGLSCENCNHCYEVEIINDNVYYHEEEEY